MSGRSNWEYKNQTSMTATERLQKALNRPVNEAIKIPEKKAPEPSGTEYRPTPGLVGTGAAADAMRKIRKRRQEALDQ